MSVEMNKESEEMDKESEKISWPITIPAKAVNELGPLFTAVASCSGIGSWTPNLQAGLLFLAKDEEKDTDELRRRILNATSHAPSAKFCRPAESKPRKLTVQLTRKEKEEVLCRVSKAYNVSTIQTKLLIKAALSFYYLYYLKNNTVQDTFSNKEQELTGAPAILAKLEQMEAEMRGLNERIQCLENKLDEALSHNNGGGNTYFEGKTNGHSHN